ncbi:hypothetical protein G7085_12055 [Tessaracoccus sp. HDW20]|uniref:hypothetical protein n=1 Tax=Tessaracoccus coleopterorum TaxID=2714950 RepID=UPI0018D3EFC1|nr:hypothetical protein [Tessaracoccus coleopterorum]NHB85102.1 hypothetical protein [Tessaracoccus coleopterorum]
MADTFPASVGYARGHCGAESGIGVTGATRTTALSTHRYQSSQLSTRRVSYGRSGPSTHCTRRSCTARTRSSVPTSRGQCDRSCPDAIPEPSSSTRWDGGRPEPRYYRTGQGFDEVARFGNILGEAVVKAVEQARPSVGAMIATAEREVALITKSYPSPDVVLERVEQLRRRESDLIASDAPYTERQTANLWLLGAECDYNNSLQALDGRLEERYASGAPYTVSALTIGGVAWVFTPGELFSDFGWSCRRLPRWSRPTS